MTHETRPGGGATVYAYDTRGRVSTVSRGPAANDLREQIEYQYDSATGNKSVERMLAWEGSSWVEKKRESFSYDSFSRLKRATHPDAKMQMGSHLKYKKLPSAAAPLVFSSLPR